MLYFMERFIEEAPARLKRKDFSMVRKKELRSFKRLYSLMSPSPFISPLFLLRGQFGRKWFQPEDASALRNRVRELLVKEFESNMVEDGIQESHTSSSASENGEQL